MDKFKINQYKSSFDAIFHYIENQQKDQVEIWFARELQVVLGYARWENFVVAINRAVESCKTQGVNVNDYMLTIIDPTSHCGLDPQSPNERRLVA